VGSGKILNEGLEENKSKSIKEMAVVKSGCARHLNQEKPPLPIPYPLPLIAIQDDVSVLQFEMSDQLRLQNFSAVSYKRGAKT